MKPPAEHITDAMGSIDRHGIYLDYQATTPLDPRVLEAMLPHLTALGNPHSSRHDHGIAAMAAVETARAQVAALVGAEPDEIVFTSGATEADNLAIKGPLASSRRDGVVTLATEHHAVLDVVLATGRRGARSTIIGVDGEGLVDLDALAQTVDEGTAVVSAMAANNEIGVLQPLAEISRIAKRAGALFHSDAAQAIGKVPFDVAETGVDMASISSHKLYGPMGVGALYMSRDAGRRISPIIEGGGQERGFRSGTLPVALCVGFGEACRISGEVMTKEAGLLRELRAAFMERLRESGVRFTINGTMGERLPGNLNLSFDGVDAEALLMRLRGKVSVASGSACTSDSLDPSHVVMALGFGLERAEEAIRIGFGRFTTLDEVLTGAGTMAEAVAKLRRVGYNRTKGA
ncbi:cysteine desulfurase family protein [Mesorhizobium sp. M1295]|uniref:cysteine desulfurase family protein n=1 Tax=Mesorhizobium sp. M1295 TaxID=2957076 RepID=UPI003339531D